MSDNENVEAGKINLDTNLRVICRYDGHTGHWPHHAPTRNWQHCTSGNVAPLYLILLVSLSVIKMYDIKWWLVQLH